MKIKVPKNKYGIITCHTQGKPFSQSELRKIINGPVAAVEPDYQRELAKPVIITAPTAVRSGDWLGRRTERHTTRIYGKNRIHKT
jgi:hypothetical protein